MKRQAKEALEAAKAKRARPAEDVNSADNLLPFTQHISTTKGRSCRWYPIEGRNLLGLSGGRSKRAVQVEYVIFLSPTDEEIAMVHLSHKLLLFVMILHITIMILMMVYMLDYLISIRSLKYQL